MVSKQARETSLCMYTEENTEKKQQEELLHGCTQDPSLAQSASSYSVTCSPITSLQEQQLAELRNTTYQPQG